MRLIDLDELQKYPFRHSNYDEKKGNLHFVNGVESLMEYAETLPIIDPEELRPRGKWLYSTRSMGAWEVYDMKCSVCSKGFTNEEERCFAKFKYCPNCGARMEEGNNEAD